MFEPELEEWKTRKSKIFKVVSSFLFQLLLSFLLRTFFFFKQTRKKEKKRTLKSFLGGFKI